ncbi:hypothetical protein [Deinococcus peraridilitoris]|uniref:hypothetical protein n=1 Tax=Deinococcus peraridilitoris TaxID=432329 RepID=UPI00031BF7A7|nr:hypothetical protein [Deinococcus peraridilitoris]
MPLQQLLGHEQDFALPSVPFGLPFPGSEEDARRGVRTLARLRNALAAFEADAPPWARAWLEHVT